MTILEFSQAIFGCKIITTFELLYGYDQTANLTVLFMVFVLLPLRMAACAKSGTIAVWFFFLWADVQPAWLGWRWKGVIVLVFTAMQQLEKIKHLGENFEEISDRFASSFDFFCCYTNTDAEVFCKWQGCVIQEMTTANLVLFN